MVASKHHKARAIGTRGPDDMASEYDFTEAGPNAFSAVTSGAVVVPLDGELAREFPTARAIQRALRDTLRARKLTRAK